jgi:hypothetical protein
MEDKGSLYVRPACRKIFQKVVRVKKNERHHFKRRIAKMEVVLNLRVSKKLRMKIMKEEHDVSMVGALSRVNHKSGHKEKVLLA